MKYFNHLNIQRIVLCTIFANLTVGCSTLRKSVGISSQAPSSKSPALSSAISKPGQKLHDGDDSKVRPLSKQAVNNLYLQLLYTQNDFDTLTYLPRLKSLASQGSIAEAVQTLLILRTPAETFKASATTESQLQEQAQPLNRYANSILAKLENNNFLQTEKAYRLASTFLSTVEATPEQWQRFITITKSQIAKLQTIANSYGDLAESAVSEDTEEEAPYQVTSYSAADLRRGDALLQEARHHAEREDFKKAIQFAKQIDDRDPFYPAAQEQIKVFSNMAVQDLRKKAANAFQRALPVSDLDTKISYLQQAKDYLEQAIKEFPEADQIETVEQNLEVISRDLENLIETKEND